MNDPENLPERYRQLEANDPKWCAYCGLMTNHQSGGCIELLRDREQLLNSKLIELRNERKRLIELSLELVWELQHLCKKPLHFEQEKEILAMQEVSK